MHLFRYKNADIIEDLSVTQAHVCGNLIDRLQ